MITANYAAENPAKVARLALYAPAWFRTTPSLVQVEGKLGAYRTVSRDAALQRWLTGVPEDKRPILFLPAGSSSGRTPPSPRIPRVAGRPSRAQRRGPGRAGVWAKGQSTYDPAKITVPVLLVLGEWDRDTPPYMAQTLFPLLTNAQWKRFAMLSEEHAYDPDGEEPHAPAAHRTAVPRGAGAGARGDPVSAPHARSPHYLHRRGGGRLANRAHQCGARRKPGARRAARHARRLRRVAAGWRSLDASGRDELWQRLLGRPASESGRLRHRAGGHEGATAAGQC